MKKILKKLFGGIELTWPKLIIFSIIMGIYTALMAMLVPDGNSFHDIAVTLEWWILPTILIIVNTKKPLEAALKTFVFFLISQPLVYMIQIPFNSMGWSLFNYYPYWLKNHASNLPRRLCWLVYQERRMVFWHNSIGHDRFTHRYRQKLSILHLRRRKRI